MAKTVKESTMYVSTLAEKKRPACLQSGSCDNAHMSHLRIGPKGPRSASSSPKRGQGQIKTRGPKEARRKKSRDSGPENKTTATDDGTSAQLD